MSMDPGIAGLSAGPVRRTYDWRDGALYAIGLGAGTDDLEYLLDDPPPKLLPTFGVVPAFPAVLEVLRGAGADLVSLLHSGQRTELIAPFPPAGEMETTAVLRGLWDMKIGALAIVDTETSVDGEPTARTSWQLLLRGQGGFGGERPPGLLKVRPPQGRECDFRVEVGTAENQALLYRLSGDVNPIHSHPEVATAAGFDRPILHGLCFYGIAARAALRELAGDDPARFRAFEARFAKVVMPGDSLVIEGWRLDEPGRAAVTVTVAGSGDRAISNGLFEYEA